MDPVASRPVAPAVPVAPAAPVRPAPPPPEARGALSVFDAVNIIVGIVVGTTIFKMAPNIFAWSGSPASALLIWLIGGVLAFIGALVYAELATSFPRDGGDYVYLGKAFGPWAGFLFGWTQLTIVLTCSIGAMAVVFGEYASNLYDLTKVVDAGGLSSTFLYAAGAIAVISLLNIIGVVLGKWVQNLLTILKVVGVLAIIVAGFGWGDWSRALSARTVHHETVVGKGEPKVSGDFQVVDAGGERPGKALESVDRPGDSPIIRLQLKPTKLTEETNVSFAYHIVGEGFRVELRDTKNDKTWSEDSRARSENWTDASLIIRTPAEDGKTWTADEIRFVAPPGSTMKVDAVVVSSPLSFWDSFVYTEMSLVALILVMYAFGGWNDAAFVAAEVDQPRTNIPRALLFGVGIITVVYLLVNLAYLVGLGFDVASQRNSPQQQLIPLLVLQKAFGDGASRAINAVIMISALGAVNGLIFTGARVYATVGNDHRLFSWLGHWTPNRGAPILALLVQALIALSMIAAFGTKPGQDIVNMGLEQVNNVTNTIKGVDPGSPNAVDLRLQGEVDPERTFDKLFAISAPFFWVFFLATGLSLFILRDVTARIGRPFSVPLYPILPIIFCNVCVWMIYRSYTFMSGVLGLTPIFVVFVIVVLLGLPLFWLSTKVGYRDASETPTAG